MTRQRVGGVELDLVGFTPPELMSTLVAVQERVRRLRREYGATPATLSVVEARLIAVAMAGRDDSAPRSSARSRHGRAPAGVAGAASPSPAPDGPVQWLSTNEAAAQLSVTPRTVQRLFDRGALDGERVDGRGTARITAASVAVEALRRTTGEATRCGPCPNTTGR